MKNLNLINPERRLGGHDFCGVNHANQTEVQTDNLSVSGRSEVSMTLDEQPCNHPVITPLSPRNHPLLPKQKSGKSLIRIGKNVAENHVRKYAGASRVWKYAAMVVLMVTLGVGQMWGQAFGTVEQQQTTMQSQQTMSRKAYRGTIYEPFSNSIPSEQSYSPAKAPGGPRRAYDSNGNWVPDAQDLEKAADTGNSNESPIGEPWVMLLMALAFGGWIAVKQVRKKIITQENNTLNKSTMKGPKFIAILVMLLTLNLGNVWGWDIKGRLFFYNFNDWEHVTLVVGNDSRNDPYEFSHLQHTKLWFSWVEWSGYNDLYLIPATGWSGTYNNKPYDRINGAGYGSNNYQPKKWDYNEDADWYIYGDNTQKDLPTYTAKLRTKLSENGGSSYGSEIADGTAWKGSFNFTGTYMSNRWTSNQSTIENLNQNTWEDSGTKDGYSGIPVTGEVTFALQSTDAAYEFVGWGTGSDATPTMDLGDDDVTYNVMGNTTYIAFFKRKQFTVTFAPKGTYGTSTVTAAISSSSISSGSKQNYGSGITFTASPASGYKIEGWYSDEACTVSLGNGTNTTYTVDALTEAQNVYVKYTPKQSTITFSQSGAGYGSGAPASNTATYGEAMTSITPPTAATGYKFQGYYDGENGTGTKYYNADGTSAKNWDKDTEEGTTLYAYFEKSQLTGFTFAPTTAAGGTSVTITPTITPTPTGTTYICWGFYSDSECTREVEGVTFSAAPSSGSGSVTFTTPAASGVYYVKGVYRTGSSCSGADNAADVLNVHVQSYIVASDHTVTVRYMCDGVEIAPRGEVVVPAASTASVTALTGDDVFGYSFDNWSLGDGVSSGDATISNPITISANYNGVLTANYTKKDIIYFKNTLGWSEVYVNLYTQDYWDSGTKGSGNNNSTYTSNQLMSQVPGTTDIFYYEYTNITTYVSFTSSSQNGSNNFWGSGDGVNAVYPTRPDATGSSDTNCGFNSGAPMFVPVTGQTGQVRNEGNDGKANYFNKGYWRKYEPATGKTGYYLEVYNKPENSSRELLYSIDMTDASTAGDIFEATIDLEAGKNYGIKVLRDNDFGYTNTSGSQMALVESGTYTELSKQPDDYRAVDMQSTTAGDYTFKLTCGSDNGKLKIAVKKPAAANDYRVVYQDAAHNDDRTQRFSRTITKKAGAEDIVSFFVDYGNTASMKFQYISAIASDGTVTWEDVTGGTIDLSSITEDGVYNFYLRQTESGISVTKVEPYTGDFYIRTDAVGGTKWADYQNAAHVMAYSEYAKNNSGYSHYWMKHLNGSDNVNVKFVVANDYSAWISDTIILQSPEVAHIDENGENTGDVSIRFSYNSATNEAKRTYLANSTAEDFLVLKNNATSGDFTDEDGVDKAGEDIKFVDHENYIYDIIAKVNPSAQVRIKVYAHYNKTDQPLIGTDATSEFTNENSKLLLNGTSSELQTIRIIYDFKTNRIVSAWQASGTTTGKLEIEADLMIVREHQEAAQNIILQPYIEKEKPDVPGEIVTNKRIYAVMRFNRWILNNLGNPNDKLADHAHTDTYSTYHQALEPGQQLPTYQRNLYYISFPFDVNVSDIFGFGTYGTHYAIQRYDGIGRAKNGYWVDSDPNWKWVPPTGKLNAYEGYVLSLSLSNMAVTNTNVWANNCSEVELYFPSAEEGFNIDTKDVPIAAINGGDSEYRCTINRGTPEGDRRIKDSYWRCIGVPSFANYDEELTSDGSTTINWQPSTANEDENGTIPFIYNINWNDKSLTAYEGSTFPFKAMHSYLVQYGGGIHWSNVVVSSHPTSVVARKRNENTSEHTYCLKLMQGDTFGDQTFVRMTDKEGVTTGFDFDQDLWKQKFANRANIYTFIGYEQVAGNSMPMSEQKVVVPVGVQVAAEGDYTFAIPDGTGGTGITLVDNETGVRTNLSALDYTVNLAAGAYNERFFLEISPINNAPTGMENVQGDNVQSTKARKVMIDGLLYIVKDGQVFDARGTKVK